MASIRERTSKAGETTWAVLWREDGRQHSKTWATEQAAEKFRTLVDLLGPAKAIAEVSAQEARGLTVDELAERFFEWKARDVEERTIADYKRDYANWIGPFLGHRQADNVDERDVQRLVDHMAQRLEPKSVADRHMILGGMYRFGAARSRQLVGHNPCLETQLPKRKKKPAKGLTLPEWKVLHAAATEVNPDAADLMLFIVSSSWRFSEATAVRVRDIDEVERNGRTLVYVRVSGVFRRGADNRALLAEDSAKSAAAMRRVVLPPTTAAMVGRRIVGKAPGDYVFTNPAGNPWRQNNFLYRTWPAILRKADLERKPTPHWLRHTHVAMLDRAGVSLAEMQRRLGHEDVRTTINVYGGMIDDMSLESLDKLDAILADAPAGEVVAGDVVGEVVRGELG